MIAFRVEGFPGLAVGLVLRGDGGEVHHAPVVALPPRRRFEQPPREVGHVPAGIDDENAPARSEARVQGGGVPVPDVLANGRGIGGRPVLERVIDNDDMPAHAGDAAAHASRPVATAVPHHLEYVRVAEVGAVPDGADVLAVEGCPGEELTVLGTVDDALNVAVHA